MKTRIELLAFAVNMYRQHLSIHEPPRILYAPESFKDKLILSGGNFAINIYAVENLPLKLVYNSMSYLKRYYIGNAYPKPQIHAAFMELKSIIEKLPVKTIPLKEVLQCPDR